MFKQFAAAALAISISTGALADPTFTSAEFLKASPTAQKNFIGNAAITAGLIAAQNKKGQAECLNQWYKTNEKNSFKVVLDAMRKLPNYDPNAVILAVFQKECGDFRYATTASVSP